MFEEEKVIDGITLKVYRFRSGIDDKALVSMVVRMQGPKCDTGNEVISPVIQSEKHKAKMALEEFDKAHAAPKNSPLVSFFLPQVKAKELAAAEAYNRARGAIVGKLGNPLFDFSNVEGEEMLRRVTNELTAKGMVLKEDTRKSNGELDEQILHFA